MDNSSIQDKTSERWEGYEKDPDWKSIRVRYEKIRREIEEEGKGKTILDVGCADGTIPTAVTTCWVCGHTADSNVSSSERTRTESWLDGTYSSLFSRACYLSTFQDLAVVQNFCALPDFCSFLNFGSLMRPKIPINQTLSELLQNENLLSWRH